VRSFALTDTELEGANEESNRANIQPRIIVYNDNTITRVIPKFAEIIKGLKDANMLPVGQDQKFKAIGWRKLSDEQRKTIVGNYYPHFNTEKRKTIVECNCFEDYLLGVDAKNLSSKKLNDMLGNAILKILSIENIQDSGTPFSIARLNKCLKTDHEPFYPEYKMLCFQVLHEYVKGNLSGIKDVMHMLADKLVKELRGTNSPSQSTTDFINNRTTLSPTDEEVQGDGNIYEHDGVRIHIGTVHSVKGETHCATLYLETYYEGKHESARLMEQLKGHTFSETKIYHKQSMKIVYVGLSRPTHLLCVAIQNERIRGHEGELENNGWLIDKSIIQCTN
jgi:hypothetical protein